MCWWYVFSIPIDTEDKPLPFFPTLRRKREEDDTTNIKAILATINTHQTKIDDHRIMISNIVNGTDNSKIFEKAVSNHYSNAGPIWTSWRDICLIILMIFALCQNLYCCIVKVQLKP
ncbi:unnamed protein product [Rotaria magnacalcarata]|nr:unnamed protein product [Rotaria magnacalcarata]CAF1969988.1 unnamed protein product [Rotaria magnacalcarata]CAF2153828.1 unnamed protein product [Rotaria magnacalcarata]CAF3980584.1 unnamed protein product [Rotaria magnacalcarata]CAF3992862.1 unnamed protein product [Rotaria magnacalcarata]